MFKNAWFVEEDRGGGAVKAVLRYVALTATHHTMPSCRNAVPAGFLIYVSHFLICVPKNRIRNY
jgi:hypothetical protein